MPNSPTYTHAYTHMPNLHAYFSFWSGSGSGLLAVWVFGIGVAVGYGCWVCKLLI